MPLDLSKHKMDIWDQVRARTGGRQALLTSAVDDTERAFKILRGPTPFKADCDVNVPFVRDAASRALPGGTRPCRRIELFSLSGLLGGTPGGYGITGLNSLDHALERPRLKDALVATHRPSLIALRDTDFDYIMGKVRLELTSHCNAAGLVPLYVMDAMVDVVGLFHACAAAGFRRGYDDLHRLVLAMSEAVVIGELRSATAGGPGIYAALCQ